MASSTFRWIYSVFRWIYNVFASSIGESFRKFFHSHLANELDRNIIDTSKEDEMEITSSSGSRRYDVFPSFSGEDVRKTFLSHLLKALDGRSIKTFIDNGIERSRPIAPELLSAIRESSISIVIFSKNYASSTWCLNELVEIHKCYKESGQMVIPVFYDVDPSEVRKQTGKFGEVFKLTCERKSEEYKQRWMQALADIADIAGEDLRNGSDEARVIEKLANDVSNKLGIEANDFGDLVGIEAHLESLKSMLCLEESEEVRMVGIVGTSGIGKSTIGRFLYSELSSQFPHHTIGTYKSTEQDSMGRKLSWEKEFLSEILKQEDIKVEMLGQVKQRLKHRKVLIVLDDVDDLELLKTLVGKTEWFGPGSRIIVITQNRQFLKNHKINTIYEVELPSKDLALKMLCRSAFEQNSPPDDFRALAVEVSELAGNLPLGLSVLGSSLKEKSKDEWMETMPSLRNGLDGKIETALKVSYDRLEKKERDMFLRIACFFNGSEVSYVNDLVKDSEAKNVAAAVCGNETNKPNFLLQVLADKSLIRITPQGHIEMHNLLVKLGLEINRAECNDNPGRRRYIVNFEEVREVFIDKTGTETVLGIRLTYISDGLSFEEYGLSFEEYVWLCLDRIRKKRLSMDEKSFEGMRNLHYLDVDVYGEDQPQRLDYLPRKLRLLRWDFCPLKSLPSNFKAEYLVELCMKYSKLEKLWDGTLQLGRLKRMNLHGCKHLREIPDLSNAINLEKLVLSECESLVTLPNYFPRELRLLEWSWCPLKCLPSNFKLEYLVELTMMGNKLEKLWEGTLPLGSLKRMNLSKSEYLKEIPDLSNAINLEDLDLSECSSLVILPSSIQYAIKLRKLDMRLCSKLESVPTLLNFESLEYFDLGECSRLRNFPIIRMGDLMYWLSYVIIVEDCIWNKNLPAGLDYLDCVMKRIPCFRQEYLASLTVRGNKMLEKLWEGVQSLGSLVRMDLSECEKLTEIPDLSKATNLKRLILNNCKSLVMLPSTIGNLQELVKLEMKKCTGMEVLPVDVNLSSLKTLVLRGCSSLRSFPLISRSIKRLYLENTAIEEVPCCIENFSRLSVLTMRGCQRLRNISPNIFGLKRLKHVDFTECGGVDTAWRDATEMGIMKDHFSCISLYENYTRESGSESDTLSNDSDGSSETEFPYDSDGSSDSEEYNVKATAWRETSNLVVQTMRSKKQEAEAVMQMTSGTSEEL